MTEPILQYYQMGEGVTAFSTTRQGGFSQGAFGQFNINPYCGDSEEAVGRNRQLLCQLLGICDDRAPDGNRRCRPCPVEPSGRGP